jgi:uncharacterized protein YciI
VTGCVRFDLPSLYALWLAFGIHGRDRDAANCCPPGEAIRSAVMDFLIYGSAALSGDDPSDTPQLNDAHWSYMDTFADRMTARGPTLSADRRTWTGSLHVVDLPDAQAARAFAINDPYHQAGLFTEHLIRRFDNLLGRTMWDFTRRSDDLPFLVIAASDVDGPSPGNEEAPPAPPALTERLLVWGKLRPVHAQRPSGVALALVAPDLDAVRSLSFANARARQSRVDPSSVKSAVAACIMAALAS